MDCKKFTQSDYEMLTKWWEAHSHPTIPFESLSPMGVLISDKGMPVCVSFLYLMHGCQLGQIAWTTTNPEAGLKQKYNAINDCIKVLCDVAKNNKRNNVICFSSSTGLTKLIQKHGFNKGSQHELLAGILEV